MDVVFFSELAKEFERLYHNCGVNKILTIEASGIGIACITAQTFGCPLVFAKKSKTLNIAEMYGRRKSAPTPTRGYTIHRFQGIFSARTTGVLVIDDFLANGAALSGLIELVEQSGAIARRLRHLY